MVGVDLLAAWDLLEGRDMEGASGNVLESQAYGNVLESRMCL